MTMTRSSAVNCDARETRFTVAIRVSHGEFSNVISYIPLNNVI